MCAMKSIYISSAAFEVKVFDSALNPLAKRSKLFKSLVSCSEIIQKFLFSQDLLVRSNKVIKLELTLHLCGNQRIRTLNKQHRGKDGPTDVLSFPVHENLRAGTILSWPLERHVHLGDIFISRDVAVRQAKEFGITYEQEILHLLVHGILHLCGYDHEISDEEETIMIGHEQRMVAKIYKKLGYEKNGNNSKN